MRAGPGVISLLVLMLLIGSCSAVPEGQGPLHTTAEHAFVRPDGEPVVMIGLNVVPVWDGRPGETWAQDEFDRIAARGFDSVRLVLHWSDFEPRRGEFNEVHLKTLDTAIERARNAGLYVVLDMIHLFGDGGLDLVPNWAVTGDSVATVQANAHDYLVLLAKRYRDEPAVAAYDLVNEPHRWPLDQNGVLAMYDNLIESVRRVDPDKIVMVEPSYGDAPITPGCADLGELRQRHNVVFSVHFYFAGGDDDGFDANCWRAGAYASDGTTGYDTSDPTAVRRHLESYTQVLDEQRIPLHIGEFGMGSQAANQNAWLDETRRLFDEHRLSRAWWEYRSSDDGRFGATDRDGSWRPFVDKLLTQPRMSAAPSPAVLPADGVPTILAVGDFTPCQGIDACAKSSTARIRDVMVDRHPDAILGLGDFQYQYADQIRNGFDLIFGPKPSGLWTKIYPTAGPTHDVKGCNDPHYRDYWERDPMAAYSFELGDWHLISLPSAVYRYDCDPESVLTWLRQDLASNSKRCTLAFWQDPYWSRPTDKHSRETAVRPWVDLLYANGADLVIQASNHNYQRFAVQDPDDRPDQERGIRAFVVGTGGVGTYAFTGSARNVEASNDATFGVLELNLLPDRYNWNFLPVPDGAFTDSGSDRCH